MTFNEDPFDLAAFRIDPNDAKLVTVAHTQRAKRRKRQFIKVPMDWHIRLLRARNIAASKVGLHLLWLHFRDNGRPTRLGNLALALEGVTQKQKLRALDELERLGLISIERRRRRSPIVTVILEPEGGT